MKRTEIRIEPLPDDVTQEACMWLDSGAIPGGYSGPAPHPRHDLAPLLAKETGSRELGLKTAGNWFRLEQSVKPVFSRLDGNEVRVIKGFDLAESVYPFPAARPMCDVDLLVPLHLAEGVLNTFLAEGWTMASPGRGVFDAGIVSEIKLYRRGVMVELHTHIFYFPATFPGRLPRDLYSTGRPLKSGLAGLDWHNALLMVLLHALTNRRMRPIWWTDIFLLCREADQGGKWMDFTKGAAGTGLGSVISAVLETAADQLDAPVPEIVLRYLKGTDSCGISILHNLRGRRRMPTLTNLKCLTGWRRISWLFALLYLVMYRQRPLRTGTDPGATCPGTPRRPRRVYPCHRMPSGNEP